MVRETEQLPVLQLNHELWLSMLHSRLLLLFCASYFKDRRQNWPPVFTLVNLYVDLVVFTHIAGTS